MTNEIKKATPVDLINDVVQSSGKVPEFDKHLKKAGGHIGRNVVEITIKTKTIVRKPLMIQITMLRLRNVDNDFLHFQYYSSVIISYTSCSFWQLTVSVVRIFALILSLIIFQEKKSNF